MSRIAPPLRCAVRFRLMLPLWLAVSLGLAIPPGARGAAPESMSATRAEDLVPRITYGGDRVLILTPGALYRLHPESETWTATPAGEGLPATPLTGLTATADDLWICGTGGCFSDIRFDDWQSYGPGEGYPGSFIYDIAADEDYAYAATDGGAGRFDLYVFEWETLFGPKSDRPDTTGEPGTAGTALGPSRAVVVDEDRVWFALDHGVAEYRKASESIRTDTLLGQLERPRVLALRQSTRYLWAVTPQGLARYDKQLESWTSYRPGIDLPDARIHQITLFGEDLGLATDAGLYWYRAESGIWRADDALGEMPGERVRAFAMQTDRTWVVTERAFAVYDPGEARWIEFTGNVPLAPDRVIRMDWSGGLLILLAPERIVYGLTQGQSNPRLFTFRERPLEAGAESAAADTSRWALGLNESGLGVRAPEGETLQLKGGVTVYVEDEASVAGGSGAATGGGDEGLGDLAYDTRVDLTLTGRLRGERTLTGFYDNTDPENEAYQLGYRGARSDVLRNLSAGEIDLEMYNSQLVPTLGLRGGWGRAELGARSAETRRRLLTADAWGGRRRTFPGRDVFRGGSREAGGEARDVDYVRRTIFAPPEDWTPEMCAGARIYRDDGNSASDNANTSYREIAGRDGAWDRLEPFSDYALGPGARTIILARPLGSGETLAAISAGEAEADLTARAVRNHYRIALDPLPGSLTLAIRDASGAADSAGVSYLERFGLDRDGDGRVDPERISPLTGMLSFPDSLPFPPEVYAAEPQSRYTIAYEYRSRQTVFQLAHRNLVPGSAQITVDREQLQANTDFSLIPATGLFVLFEHIVLDDDSVIEIDYMYEVIDGDAGGDDQAARDAYAGQIGIAPSDHVFVGASAMRWDETATAAARTLDANARLEWKSATSLVRLLPEIALSARDSAEAVGAASRAGETGGTGTELRGRAAAVGLQVRHHGLEVSATHRALGADFTSLEDRRTLLGRLREESRANARWTAGAHWQTTLEWSESRSDRVATREDPGAAVDSAGAAASGHGAESALIGTVRFLRAGFPNVALRHGLVSVDAPAEEQEKRITRLELEYDPAAERLAAVRIRRLWLRSFFQRSDRRFAADGDTAGGSSSTSAAAAGAGDKRRVTDHAYARLNGSAGNPLTWNLTAEDRRTHAPQAQSSRDLRRAQRLDVTLQTRPHAALDGYLRGESTRDLFWSGTGRTEGFDVERLLLGKVHFYPGRLCSRLAPVSLRADISRSATERGEPGSAQPGASSLLRSAADASERRRVDSHILESQIQLLSWMRLVERWERAASTRVREGLAGRSTEAALENRLEIRPRAGLLTLRLTAQEADEESGDRETLRFHGDWDQAWGAGLLTYLSFEASRGESRQGRVGSRTEILRPQGRLTVRRDLWQLDASLGISYTISETEDLSASSAAPSNDSRGLSLTAVCNLQPWQPVGFKLQYAFTRSRPESMTGLDSGREWSTAHDLKLRLTLRV